LNKPNVVVCVVDHGLGAAIAENDLDNPAFSAHRQLVKSLALPVVDIAPQAVSQEQWEMRLAQKDKILNAEREKTRKLEIDLSEVIRQRDAAEASLRNGKP
jgi:hypothetical protein